MWNNGISEISEEMVWFLRAVFRFGQEGKFRLYKSLRISAKRFDSLVESAESRGLIKTYEVESGGRPLKVIVLTEKGKEVIRKFLGRRGGVWHQKAIQKVIEHYEKVGDKAYEESGGRAEEPDLTIITRDGRKIIWQFESDASHPDQVLKNFENFRFKCDAICIGVPNDSVGKRVIDILSSKGYEVRKDFLICRIPLEEEGEENVY